MYIYMYMYMYVYVYVYMYIEYYIYTHIVLYIYIYIHIYISYIVYTYMTIYHMYIYIFPLGSLGRLEVQVERGDRELWGITWVGRPGWASTNWN